MYKKGAQTVVDMLNKADPAGDLAEEPAVEGLRI
jgi:hypothetical protein